MPGHRAASLELATRDPVLARLVAAHRPMSLGPRTPVAKRFEAIARSIVYQQLAGRAAASIWSRTRALADGLPFGPELVLSLPEAHLRGAGLSAAKARALTDLAEKVAGGAVRLDRLGRMTDDEVVAELIQVRGVGEWTAHMFLLFHLHRLDVWPTGDFGVRNGYRIAWALDEMPTPKALAGLGEPFRPYRSVAAWYCWRAVDGIVPVADEIPRSGGTV